MASRRQSSMNFQNDSSIFNSPVTRNFHSRHSMMSETLNFSRMSTTLNTFNSINDQTASRTLTPQRTFDNSTKTNHNLSSFSKTLELLNESEEDDAKEEDISKMVIFEAFFHISKRLNHSNDALNLLEEFDQTCDENLIYSNEMLSNKLRPDSETKYFERFSKLVRSERDTWKLFRMLYLDRIEVQGAQRDDDNDDMDIDEDLRLKLGDADLAQLSLQRNTDLREIQIIVNWLEAINDEKLDQLNDYMLESDIYWENTFKHDHQQQNRLDGGLFGSFGGNSNIFSNNSQKPAGSTHEMDPDAFMRTGNKICDDDKEQEDRLFKTMFRLIRRGRIDDAQDIAERAGFWWLSSALDGWKLHHDPNYVEKKNDTNVDENGMIQSPEYSSAVKELATQTGNPLRDLWKQHAWNFAKVSGSNVYERALFAAFSGNRNILLPLCNTWKDRMWAFFRCSLEANLERIFRETAIDKPDLLPRTSVELPEEFWDNQLSAEEIFNELAEKDLNNEDDYHREIVKLLILGRINELVNLLFQWTTKIKQDRTSRKEKKNLSTSSYFNISSKQIEDVQEKCKYVEPNLLRFFAHIAIAMLQLKLLNEHELNESCLFIIEAYTEFLVEYKFIELVAHYSQFLPHERQVKAFSSLLETIDNEEDRQLCMEIAKEAQMNLPVLLSTVVERIQSNASGNNSQLNTSILNDSGDNDEHDSSLTGTSRIQGKKILLTPQVTVDDYKRINALNWLILDPDNSQYVELLKQVNALIRSFLMEQKVDLAKETISTMPENLIEKAYFQWKSIQQAQVDASSNLSEDGSIETASTAPDVDIENIVREYICHRIFFDAKDAFESWHRCLYQDRPHPPIEPRQMLKLSERVAYEQSVKEYEQNRKLWLAELGQEAESAWDKICVFLQFPDNIWCDVEGLNTLEKVAQSHLQNSNNNNNDKASHEDDYINALTNPNEDRMSTVSSVFNDANARQLFESALKRAESREPDFLPISGSTNTRNEQFINLRRIYINQYLILLSTIIKESYTQQQASPKLIFEKVTEILSIAESDCFRDVITQNEMKDLILKLAETLNL